MLDLVVLVLVIAAAIALAPYLGALLLFAAAVFMVLLAIGVVMEGLTRLSFFMDRMVGRVSLGRSPLKRTPSVPVGSV